MTSSITKLCGAFAFAVTTLVLGSPVDGSAQSTARATKEVVVAVKGMTCEEMCAPSLHKQLVKLPGVKDVDVSAKKGSAVITFNQPTTIADKVIEDAVAAAGFTATKITRQKREN